MSTELLTTKLYIPPLRPNAVTRPRLVEKMVTRLSQPDSIVLLSGPAGFGKTTLLSEFTTRVELPVAWVSLDEGDNDPVRFWSYFIAACQTVRPDLGASAQAMLRSAQPLPAEAIPTSLINELASQELELVLILDDFQAIQDESVQASFIYLLEHLPRNLHLVVSTRIDPPWPLARYRVRNQLVEVRIQDLRFTPAEASAFLNQMMGLDLSPDEIAALEKRTEGWIAGLHLAALSLQGRRDAASFVKDFTGSHLYVADYLVEEVLQRQPEDVQTFLRHTSILERLSAGLCEALTGRQDAQELLATLHRANLFLIPLDNEGRWYRYHHLFADLLQARLQHAAPAEEITNLHRVAASWYGAHGFLTEAVNHALATRDYDHAARLIGQNAAEMLTRGELATLLRWTGSLPGETIWRHPPIVISKIWALTLAGAVRQVEPLLQQAEAQFETSRESPTARELAGIAAAIRAFFAMMTGDDPHALELAERAEALLPEPSVHARWLLPYTTAAAFRGQGRYAEAEEAFARQAWMGEEHGNLIVWGTGMTGVALVRRAQGRLQEASQVCLEALARLADLGAAQSGSLAKLEVPLVEVLVERNELEEAGQRLSGIMARLQTWLMPTDQIHAQLALVELQQAQGDLPGAFETLRKAQDLKATRPILMNLARLVDLSEIRLHLASGDLATAERLLEALQPGTSRWVELRAQELLLLARLRLKQGRLEEADKILAPLAREAKKGQRKGHLIEALTLQACVQAGYGETPAALTALTRALALAEPEGFVRLFVDAGEGLQRLLAAIARQPETTSDQAAYPSKAYVARLLEVFPAGPAPKTLPPAQAGALVEQLTPREIEVLQLIAAGASNRAVAEKLVITVSAVKKHASNIYGKLNVSSRTQAVARARQLGLLPADD